MCNTKQFYFFLGVFHPFGSNRLTSPPSSSSPLSSLSHLCMSQPHNQASRPEQAHL
jgi:hypothetical protein